MAERMVQISLTRSVIWAAAVAILVATHTCFAFQPISPFQRALHDSTLRASPKDDTPTNEGQELADQFFEQLKKRENHQSDEDNVPRPKSSSAPPMQPNTPSAEDFTMDTKTPPKRKFTGASPSLFSERTSSSSNLESEQEREFNLVGNFERTLGIQAAILFASIVFVASVGFTGGISDGSDRYFGGLDEIDDTAIEYSRTDDAAEAMVRQSTQESIWL
jgi:hypothetical protein